jgi:hypothetical protein
VSIEGLAVLELHQHRVALRRGEQAEGELRARREKSVLLYPISRMRGTAGIGGVKRTIVRAVERCGGLDGGFDIQSPRRGFMSEKAQGCGVTAGGYNQTRQI